MNDGCKKYLPFNPTKPENRKWPDKIITKAPTWCSVDLRDGNQALVTPMNQEEKLTFFKTLVNIGFKEIEVGFPSASQTEYDTLRAIIDNNLIPDDVTIQVLVQARDHLIRRTFESVKGAKNVIIHFYNSTSVLQRNIVFNKDKKGIIDIAVKGAKLIKELTDEAKGGQTNFRFEYSPESFSGTETEFAVEICNAVTEVIQPTKSNPLILNLPNTVEMCTPNTYADQVEYFCNNIPDRESTIISIHPHNDRGTGVAGAELALLAGAERVEGTLFGNGERTGNLDIITLALNMYTQGIDPALDFSDLSSLRKLYEKTTGMSVHERHPYAGDLAFTAFSGSHQDAINKGYQHMENSGSRIWQIPYLPIDPADIGRAYEPIVRINSQSGKGGAAFIMQNIFGYTLPKEMHPEFGTIVQNACERSGKELTADEIFSLFTKEYLNVNEPYKIEKVKFYDESEILNGEEDTVTHFEGIISKSGVKHPVKTAGNGPIDAFYRAMQQLGAGGYKFISYSEHAISMGSDAKAIAYIQIQCPDGKSIFGAGIEGNINFASVKGFICAINRAMSIQKSGTA